MNDDRHLCLDYVRVYLGLPPYEGHHSSGSGYYYQYLILKFGHELVEECKQELENESSNI